MSVYNSLIDSPFNREFAGLRNYIDLIQNPVFQRALINSVLFTGLSVPLLVFLSLALALRLNKATYKRGLFRTLAITPLVCPTASIVIVWQILFKRFGLLNSFLLWMDFPPIDWLNSEYSLLVIISLFIWKNLGYNMILFLAGLNSIPKSYFDVARCYGAGSLFIFFRITLAYLAPVTIFVVIISIINSFKVFREIFLLTGYYPDKRLYMIQHYINNTFVKLDLQKLSSASVIMAFLIFILVYYLFNRGKKDLSYG
ncbi:carbohydrate ABC transporter permease [Oceanispirochaeta sp. M1]|uniref:carbohydrate ABC transporter permease n=2 Tax=Oceanispirochaeta TaxID=2035349 RepID=UPI001C12F217|nr:sugar ABC transporter permease [Oceanispirochaeta sp. M1]